MATSVHLKGQQAYEIADGFAQASARILEFRVLNRAQLDPYEAKKLEDIEDKLDSLVVFFRGLGIRLIGANAQAAAVELSDAVDTAKETLKTIADIKSAIKLAAAVLTLAMAVYKGDAQGVVTAVRKAQAAAAPDDDKPEN